MLVEVKGLERNNKQTACPGKVTSESIDKYFLQDVIGFFERKNTLGRWGYSSPKHPNDIVRGKEYYDKWICSDPNYYVLRNEIALISSCLPVLSECLGYLNISRIVDLGCGTPEATKKKIVPLLINTNIRKHTAVDFNRNYARISSNLIKDLVDNCASYALCCNFLEDTHTLFFEEKSAYIMFGGTVTNFGGITGFKNLLSSIKKYCKQGDHFIFTHDQNQDKNIVTKSYNHPLQAKLTENVMHLISRDLGNEITGNFDPYAWKYKGISVVHKHLKMQLCLTPTKSQNFYLSGKQFTFSQNDILVENSIDKIPVIALQKITEKEGFKKIGIYTDPVNGYIVLHHYVLDSDNG